MGTISKAEGQRKLSQILTAKRKQDPVGLLRAQRNGTLNEYLREDLAKHGLAVAGDPVPSTKPSAATAASAAPSKPSSGNAADPTAATVASASAAAPSTQRHSYKAPSPTKTAFAGASSSSSSSAATAAADPAGKAPRGCLASLGQIDQAPASVSASPVPFPPPAAQEQQRDQAPTESKRAPGKLSASRFGSFRNDGSKSIGGSAAGAPLPTPPSPPVSAAAAAARSRSNSPRRWTVGPVSSPTKVKEQQKQEQEQERTGEQGAAAGTTTTPPAASTSSSSPSSSVRDLTSRFGGAGLGLSPSGSPSRGGAGGGKRSTSGRIAELTRKFEK